MIKLLACFALLTGCIHAQQSFPGINITPNGGNAGKIQLRTSANVNSMFVQDATISAASAGKAITVTGATATDGRILLNPGNVSTKASVSITAPAGNTSDPSLVIFDGGNSGATNGIQLNQASGTQYMKLDSNGGIPTIALGTYGTVLRSTDFTMYNSGGFKRAALLPGGSFGGGILQLFNQAGTFVTGFSANSAMTSSAVYQLPLADGSSGNCLSTNGSAVLSWISCGTSGANTTLSNLTSPTSINQNLNMNANSILWSSGTNLQTSQLGIWGAGVQRVLISNGGVFGSGIIQLANAAGDRTWGFKAATATTGTSVGWILPTSDGSGYFKSDGAGNMSIDTSGHTGSTCSAWTNGLCTAP